MTDERLDEIEQFPTREAVAELVAAVRMLKRRLGIQERAEACVVCGGPIMVGVLYRSPGGDARVTRSKRRFCSNRCKTKDHRGKVKRAKEMKESGRSVSAIAAEFDTTAETISRWLTKKK
jgi:hypothetical protein